MPLKCSIPRKRSILYHGTPYEFKEFKEKTTFFSDTFNFACWYAREKSQDYELDADITVIKCEFNGSLFDINNPSCERLLTDLLPEKIYVPSTEFFGLFGGELQKKDVIELMKGFDTVEPLDLFLNANIGDEITKPQYTSEKWIVIDKTSDHIYLFDLKRFYDILDAISRDYNRYHGYSEDDYRRDFGHVSKEYMDYIDLIRKREIKKLPLTRSLPPFPYYLSPEEQKKEELLKGKMVGYLKADLLKNRDRLKKIPLKTYIEKLDDTWRFFENSTVLPVIKDLGFDGYVAKERKENTYAIFSPSKTIMIIERLGC